MQISVVLWDLMPRRLSLSNAATLENMLVVKQIKHVHCHFCIYKARFFSFLFIWFLKCVIKNWQRTECVLQVFVSFSHCSPATGSSCMPAAHTSVPPGLSTSPFPGVHLCHFSPRLAFARSQRWCPSLDSWRFNTLCWLLSSQLLGKTQAALIVLGKF